MTKGVSVEKQIVMKTQEGMTPKVTLNISQGKPFFIEGLTQVGLVLKVSRYLDSHLRILLKCL